MLEDRMEQLIKAADVRNDELRNATLDRIRLMELLRDRETAFSLRTAEDVKAFLDEKGFSAEDFVHVVRILHEDEAMEDAEISGSELRDVAGGFVDGMAPGDTSRLVEAIEDFIDWVSGLFD